MKINSAQEQLRQLADPVVAAKSGRYFKTGKGEYGERYRFLGVRMPQIRAIAKQNLSFPVKAIIKMLPSPYNEERLLALIMLVYLFEKGDDALRREIYLAYLDNTQYINGWDLVDCSAIQIVGGYLFDQNRQKLVALSTSKNLWERRIAIVSTFYFIRRHQYEDTLAVSEQLLGDKEDLIHKAVGWMLREIGNRDRQTEVDFLALHYQKMPRIMLRYAIEKFDKIERDKYLSGTV